MLWIKSLGFILVAVVGFVADVVVLVVGEV